MKIHPSRLRHRSAGTVAFALLVALLLAALLPTAASARTTRLYESSFGYFKPAFGAYTPEALAVDQSNGDIYVVSQSIESPKGSIPTVSRFTAAGVPKNFTAGPDAGTNTLTGFLDSDLSIAIDNSGGPLNGTVYIAIASSSTTSTVKAYAGSGASLGTIVGSGVPRVGGSEPETFGKSVCGLAVDQSNGALYIAGGASRKIWRYAPSSPAGAIDDSDYTLTGVTLENPCGLAAASGSVYTLNESQQIVSLERFSASSFSADTASEPVPTTIDTSELKNRLTAVAVDPKNGDLYVNGGNRVAVFDSTNLPLYSFGAPAYFNSSAAIAVKSAASGPAANVYVADPGSVHEVDVFGALNKVPAFTHNEGASAGFGPDGTSGSSFGANAPGPLAFDQATRRHFITTSDGSVSTVLAGVTQLLFDQRDLQLQVFGVALHVADSDMHADVVAGGPRVNRQMGLGGSLQILLQILIEAVVDLLRHLEGSAAHRLLAIDGEGRHATHFVILGARLRLHVSHRVGTRNVLVVHQHHKVLARVTFHGGLESQIGRHARRASRTGEDFGQDDAVAPLLGWLVGIHVDRDGEQVFVLGV